MIKYIKALHLSFNMILRGFFCILLLVLIYSSGLNSYASDPDSRMEMADKLKELGLFEGTENGYELDTFASRNQSAVMLVRYLGKEDIAIEAYKAGDLSHPFNDVPLWASPHVAYLYQTGLTNGISSNSYGGKDIVTGNQYSTMLLRMLGYDDEQDDFKWTKALEFIKTRYKLSEKAQLELSGIDNVGITRGEMVELSYLSLYFDFKSVNHKVIDHLYFNEVISKSNYVKYNVYDEVANDYSTEVKGIWLSYLDIRTIIRDNSSFGFRNEIKKLMNNVSDNGFNTIFVQVRPFSDALYTSSVYDWSYIMTGTDGEGLGFDPLEIIIEEAKTKEIKIEAWINPYRIRNDVVKEPLNPKGKVADIIRDNQNITFQVGNKLMFNPAFDQVQKLIVEGVLELVRNYDIDGIHFDDYFYPNNDMSLDLVQYNDYIEQGGALSHGDFRRNRINLLVKDVYQTVKSEKPNVRFGISPQGSTINNYEHTFIDVEEWIDNPGYIDYICPQIYYGFDNETLAFSKVLKEWSEMVKNSHVELLVGLAGYKVGLVDNWAGTGKQEWVLKDNRLELMIEASRSANNYNGISIFRYDSLFNPSSSVKDKIELELLDIKRLFTIPRKEAEIASKV